MPDAHRGFGMPIGGVLLTQGGVVPNAVGVDIGCGMIAARLSYRVGNLLPGQLEAIRQEIHKAVPVGNGPGGNHEDDPTVLLSGELEDKLPGYLDRAQSRRQAGTLGGGNHFIEVQSDGEHLWLMLHSGSRALGKKTCDRFHAVALAYSQHLVPDKDLAFLPMPSIEAEEYLYGMRWCMAFAEQNRARMLAASLEAMQEVLGGFEVTEQIETHHNFAAYEEHYGEGYWVHRKGAVKAEGLVTIPGSMGTASYIGRGLNPTESFNTCSHGAGRVLGRRQANRQITHEEAVASMSHVVFGVRQGDYDETPMAYKDIEQVMRDQADLVEPVHRLTPLAVVKG